MAILAILLLAPVLLMPVAALRPVVGKSGARRETILIKTYGGMTDFQRGLIKQYELDLDGTGMKLAVLHADASVAPSFGDVPVCAISLADVNDTFPEAVARMKLVDGCKSQLHCYDDALVALWWRSCAGTDAIRPEHLWVMESDAFFSGNVSRFLLEFAQSDADFIASGFRLAAKSWWGLDRHMYDSAFEKGMQLFHRTDAVVENVDVLPVMFNASGNCPDYQSPQSSSDPGLLFYYAFVMRLSGRLLDALAMTLDEGVVGKTEAFVSSLCASQIGFQAGQECTLLDFAPLQQQSRHKSWLSPLFCFLDFGWGRDYTSDIGFNGKEHCILPEWKEKWIHPVKTDVWNVLECSPADVSLQSVVWQKAYRLKVFFDVVLERQTYPYRLCSLGIIAALVVMILKAHSVMENVRSCHQRSLCRPQPNKLMSL